MDCLTKFSGTGTEDNKTDILTSLGSTAGVYHFPHGGKSSPNPFPIRCERFIPHQRALGEKKKKSKKASKNG